MVTDRTVPKQKHASLSITPEIRSELRGFSRREFIKLYHITLGQVRQEFSKIFISNHGLLSSSESIHNYITKETTLSKQDPEFFTKLGYEAAYLLLNKIVTYTLVQHYVQQAYGIKIGTLYDPRSRMRLEDQLQNKFRDITQLFELGPIFYQTLFLTSFQYSEQLQSALKEFVISLAQIRYDNSALSSFGNIFQEIIPVGEQKRLGQIYTPPEIASFMAELSIRSPSDIILDPACGCGSLLLKSYSILQNLISYSSSPTSPTPTFTSSEKLHKSLIEQIWGVEIGLFPAHIAMLSLAFLDLSSVTPTVGILMEDFLEIGPLKKYFVKSKNLQTGDPIVREMPSKYDVILANPPYIKQEKIPNKKAMIKNLPIYAAYRSNIINQPNQTRQTRPSAGQKSRNRTPKIKMGLTGKTDYYGYFLWYSTFFLKERGRLCFIIPNKWLDVKYGEKIKEFLLQKFQLRAIIGFEKNVFPNAQVSTVILIADKCQDSELRANTTTYFMLLQKTPNISQIQAWINSPPPTGSLKASQGGSSYKFFNDVHGIKRTEISQQFLNPHEKWSIKYIYQSRFSQLVESCQLISLDNGVFSRVLGGIKTGANDFYFPSSENINQFGISNKFLKPGIRSGRNIPNSFIVNQNINPFLSIPANYVHGTDPGLDKYIRNGEEVELYPDRPSVIWTPWYRIPESSQDSPDILFLRHIDRSFRAHWNQIHAIVADGVRGITVLEDKWHLFLLGVCNSTFFYWQAHLRGRWEGQGDLQLLVYELRQFRIPDPRSLSYQVVLRVETAMNTILTASTSIHDVDKNNQETLDRAVLATMNLESAYEVLISETSTLESRRLKKARK